MNKLLYVACIIAGVHGSAFAQQNKAKTPTSNTSKVQTAPSTTVDPPTSNTTVKQSTGPLGNTEKRPSTYQWKSQKINQNYDNQGITWGIRAAIAQVITLENEGSKIVPSYEVGILANIPLATQSAIQAELLYLQRSTKYDLTSNMNTQIGNRMLSLPILYQYSWGGSNMPFFVNVGPYISYLLSVNRKLIEPNKTTSESIDLTNFSFSNRLEAGIGAGFGANITSNITAELRGYYNIKKLEGASRAATVSLGVGYLF